jgi:hypothetical protein
MHFLNKGGGCLKKALHGKERRREWPILQISGGDDFLRDEVEERKKD